MMTVRSPTGFSIQYNDANFASRFAAGYTDLYDKKDGRWIAQVPNDWVIEVVRPCRLYDAANQPEELAAAFLQAVRERRALPPYKLADIKTALKAFNGKTKRWSHG